MSRGHRDATFGILKASMRDNYTEHGVDDVCPNITSLIPDRELMCLSNVGPVLQEGRRDISQPALPGREELFVSVAQQVRSPSRCLDPRSLKTSPGLRWWRMRQPHIEGKKFMVFDMACGSSLPHRPHRSVTDTSMQAGNYLNILKLSSPPHFYLTAERPRLL